MKISTLLSSAILSLCMIVFSPQAFSQAIIEDEFTGSGNLNGSTPDVVNIPSGTWTLKTVAGAGIWGNPQRGVIDGSYTNTVFNTDISQAIKVNTTPITLILESEFKINTVSGTGSHWGMGFGFFGNTNNTSNSFIDFYGLILDTGGNLKVWTNAPFVGSPAASVNITNLISFSASNYNTVKYTVDTTSGVIHDVYINNALVSGLDGSYTSFIGNTSFAGIMTSSAGGGGTGNFNTFVISSVPEPVTYTMLTVGMILTFLGLRFSRRSQKSFSSSVGHLTESK